MTLQRQGRYDEAEPVQERAAKALERVLGREHPHTLTSTSNLASLYVEQGRHSDAEPLLGASWRRGRDCWALSIQTRWRSFIALHTCASCNGIGAALPSLAPCHRNDRPAVAARLS